MTDEEKDRLIAELQQTVERLRAELSKETAHAHSVSDEALEMERRWREERHAVVVWLSTYAAEHKYSPAYAAMRIAQGDHCNE